VKPLAAISLAIGVALAAAAPAPAAPAEPLGHAGRWITDAEGRVVVMHGVAVVVGGAFGTAGGPERTAEQVGFSQADADFLAEQGFNVVRLGMFFRGFSPEPGVYDEEYLASFLRTHRQLARAGIFTVVDFHQDQLAPRYNGRGFPDWFLDDDGLPNGGQPFPQGYFANPALNRAYDNLWANAPGPGGMGLQDRFAEGWGRVAAAFAGEQHLLGYDIFNEPWPGSAWPSCANPAGCPPGGFDQTALTAFSNRIIAAIRAADPNHVAFYEPNLQFDVGAATRHGKVDDSNAGFSFHNYCLGAAPGLPAFPDPVGACENVGETLVFENAEAHARETGAALLMTEFGDTEDPAIHDRVADLADRFMVSWTDWAYMGSTGQIKKDDAAPPTPDNLRQARLDSVVRPYPQRVAGTPRSFGYDDEANEFELVYSTEAAAAGNAPVSDPGAAPASFGAGSETEVVVPQRRFPNGYRVEVSGAEVRSQPDAPLLVLASCEAAEKVRVRVGRGIGPARGCARQSESAAACVFSLHGTRRADRLRGTRSGERISGGRGADRLLGRGGRDCLRGGRGADRVSAADGIRDRIDCGKGRGDVARVDAADRVRACERVRKRAR
jgi:endoglycosylceramidase